jgi:opacity protein-like surface antigen
LRRPTFAAILLIVLATPALAADAAIEHLTAAANTAGQVSVRFQLAHAFDRQQVLERLQSGVPTTLTYVVEIFRDRPNWFDEGVGRVRIEVIATFNSLTREYLLNYRRDRKLVRSETFSDLAALRQAMTTVSETNLFDIERRPPYKMKVRAKADLSRGWLLYVIPWQVSTRWSVARVIAPAAESGRP